MSPLCLSAVQAHSTSSRSAHAVAQMSSDASSALRELRDALRGTVPDTDSLVFLLSAALQSVDLHPTSIPPTSIDSEAEKALRRFLPIIQSLLISNAIPTFLPALDQKQRDLLDRFFCPPKPTTVTSSHLSLVRTVALQSYLALSELLSSQSKQGVTPAAREYVLQISARLAGEYSIDQLYWAVWGSAKGNREDRGANTLAWEDVVKAACGLPYKVANAVGRWKAEGWDGDVPEALVPKAYFDRFASRLESLMYETSQITGADPSPIRSVIEKLASLGLLTAPPSNETSPTPSLLSPIFPALLRHLHPEPSSGLPSYPAGYLTDLVLGLASSTLAAFVDSLMLHLTFRLLQPTSVDSNASISDISLAAHIMREIIGPSAAGGEAWQAVLLALIGKKIASKPMDPQVVARYRVIIAWVALSESPAVQALLEAILLVWTDPKYIKFALYAQQFYLTFAFLLAIGLLPQYHPFLLALSHRAQLVIALQSYIGHPDPKIRRLGMLVGEVLSERTIEEDPMASQTSEQEEIEALKAGLDIEDQDLEAPPLKRSKRRGGKRLNFGADMWDGEGQGKEECRWLRRMMGVRDVEVDLTKLPASAWLLGWDLPALATKSSPAASILSVKPVIEEPKAAAAPTARKQPSQQQRKIVMLDEDQELDPLEGYAVPSPSSSRSASPTKEYLEEVAADPSLAIGRVGEKKITRPVYLQQLVLLLKEREKPECVEMGLKWGEGLVRAKRAFGTELADNAEPLIAMTIALSDPWDIDGFEEKRQGLLISIVACAPKQAAPYVIELYFTGQYALHQRSVLLTALAMGARELAGMTVAFPASTTRRIDFPTKTLPPGLHRKYFSPSDAPLAIANDPLEDTVAGVRDLMLSKGARKGEETIPELAREKRLRVSSKRQPMIAEVGSFAETQVSSSRSQQPPHAPVTPFRDIAAEFFIMPLINRFWQYFQDSQTREARAVAVGNRYRAAGTGLILSPMALEKLLMTLSILLHAARHGPTFLAVLCPEAIELALTIGSRYRIRGDEGIIEPTDGANQHNEQSPGAQVVTSALELTLVCLDNAYDLDKGRTIVTDKPELVLAVGEWAHGVFSASEKGERMSGEGGQREGRVRATAAGVVVKVSEIGEKWGHLGLPR